MVRAPWIEALLGIGALLLSACSGPLPPATQAEAMRVELRGVTIRQYRQGELLGTLTAASLSLDGQSRTLRASGPVQAELQPGLWRR